MKISTTEKEWRKVYTFLYAKRRGQWYGRGKDTVLYFLQAALTSETEDDNSYEFSVHILYASFRMCAPFRASCCGCGLVYELSWSSQHINYTLLFSIYFLVFIIQLLPAQFNLPLLRLQIFELLRLYCRNSSILLLVSIEFFLYANCNSLRCPDRFSVWL